MKQVNARQDGDPVAQKLLNILPTISVPASGWVLGGERINDADLRRAAENRIEIDGLALGSLECRNRLQFPQDCLNFLGLLSLNRAYNNIFSALMAPSRLIEHAIGFAYTWRVT